MTKRKHPVAALLAELPTIAEIPWWRSGSVIYGYREPPIEETAEPDEPEPIAYACNDATAEFIMRCVNGYCFSGATPSPNAKRPGAKRGGRQDCYRFPMKISRELAFKRLTLIVIRL